MGKCQWQPSVVDDGPVQGAVITDPVFEVAFDKAPIGMALVAPDGQWMRVNPTMCAIVGYSEGALLDMTFQDITHPDDLAADMALVARVLADEIHTYTLGKRYLRSDGSIVHVQLDVSSVWQAPGKLAFFISQVQDVTARINQTVELEAAKQLAETTLSSINDAIIRTDEDGRITLFNPAAERLTGWTADQAGGRLLNDVVILDDVVTDPLKGFGPEVEGNLGGWEERLLSAAGGRRIPVETSLARLPGPDGRTNGILLLRDVSVLRELAQKLKDIVARDPLTGAYSRHAFEAVVEAVLERRNAGQVTALIYVDLDQFKLINDRWGHLAGDALLRQVAALITGVAADLSLCRFGGDEFAVVINRPSLNDVELVAEAIREAVGRHRYAWSGEGFVLTASLGVAPVFDPDDISAALSHADAACIIAKANGRNRVHVYRVGEAEISRYLGDIEWIEEVRAAIADDRLLLYGQTIFAADGAAIAVEVLSRLRARDGTLVPPGTFIAALERFSMTELLDRWVMQTALRRIGELPAGTRLFVNVSGASLSSRSYRHWLLDLLSGHRDEARRLVIEVTETYAIQYFAELRELVVPLKQLGAAFAIDDFGSGFANLTYVRELSADYLKIDGRLTTSVEGDEVTRRIVETICAVAPQIAVKTIAEHVETLQQAAVLRALGADALQGFALHRPEPLHR